MFAGVCIDTRVSFFFNVHPKALLLISCAFFFFTLSYADESERKVLFYAYTHRFLIQRVPAGVCVHVRLRALPATCHHDEQWQL